jgi:hypothetical protein
MCLDALTFTMGVPVFSCTSTCQVLDMTSSGVDSGFSPVARQSEEQGWRCAAWIIKT